MKRTIAIVLACLLALTMVAACDQDAATDSGSQGTTSNSSSNASSNTSPNSTSNTQTNSPNDSSPPPESSFDASRVIAVYTREEGSGTRDAFVSLTGVGEDMYIEAIVNSETNQILTNVEINENAIGYVSIGSLNPAVKALEIDGVMPSNETVTDGSYTLQRPFLLCVNSDNDDNPLVQDFLSFVLSAEGQEISATKWTAVSSNAPRYAPSNISGTLKIGGSTSVEPLMQSLSQAYRAHNPNVVIEISLGGSGTGISEATSGVLNIGMSSRALRDSEREALTGIEIALDGVAVIVNPANPASAMTIDQVREIFTGEITRWNQVIG